MLDLNNNNLTFKSESAVEAYSKFFLSVNPINALLEFKTDEEILDFNIRRERSLKAHMDFFRNVDFSKTNVIKVETTYSKICKASYQKPLSSEGANLASSRFNYKSITLLKNKTIYFGKSKKCCEIEKFHQEYQREVIKKTFSPDYEFKDSDILFPKHVVKQYDIVADNVLVLTSKPSLDAVGLTHGSFMNEWYEANELYEIPSSSQILGTIARIHGFKGIMYTSTRYQIENNLVLFEENCGELNFKEKDSQDYSPSPEIIEGISI